MKYCLVIGVQNSGKTTQMNRAAKNFDLGILSSSKILETNPDYVLKDGRIVKEITSWGGYVPDEDVKSLIKLNLKAQNNSSLISDSYPRTPEQLNDAIELGIEPTAVIYLSFKNFENQKNELMRRIMQRQYCKPCNAPYDPIANSPKKPNICDNCGQHLIKRSSDTPENLERRLQEDAPKTLAMLNILRKKWPSRIYEFDALLHPDTLEGQISDILEAML